MTMAKSLYMYDVYDGVLKKKIVVNGRLKDVTKVTGLPAIRANKYAETGYVYKNRYVITKIKIDEVDFEDENEDTKSFWTQELKKEWDRVRFMINPNAKR